MQISAIPTKLDLAFAEGADTAHVRTIPDTTSDPNAASWTLGYPPNTFVDPASGGAPPDGRDMNGLGFMTTAWVRWGCAGGWLAVGYDSVFSASVGGYMKGAMIAAASGPGNFWISTVDNNTSDPDTGGANWLAFPPSAAVSVTSFNGRTGAVTLTQSDCLTAVANGGWPLAKLATGGPGPLLIGIPTGSGPGSAPVYGAPSVFGVGSPTFAQAQNAQSSGGGSGETLTGNSWNQRVLNSLVANSISGASLSGNQLTLPAGIYQVTASAMADKHDAAGFLVHKLRIRDVTHGVTLVSGQNAGILGYAGTTEIGTNATLAGFFTLSGTAAIEVDSWPTSSGTGGGGGSFSPPTNSGETEVYVNLCVMKIG